MKKLTFLSILLIGLVAEQGWAEDAVSTYLSGPHAYVSFDAGTSQIYTSTFSPNIYPSTTRSVYQPDVGGAIGILAFNPDHPSMALGAEFGMSTYGQITQTGSNLDSGNASQVKIGSTATDLMAVGRFTFIPAFFTTVKVGAAYVVQNVSVNDQSSTDGDFSYNVSNNRVAPALGVGVGANFTPHLSASLDAGYIFGKRPDMNNPNTYNQGAAISSLNATISYLF